MNNSADSYAELELLPHHAEMLAASAIDPQVATARGYRSIETKAELKRLGFSDVQCRTPAVAVRADVNRTTLAALLGTVGMLFAAFTAAYLERSVGHDWVPIELPGVVTWSTIAVVLSSVTLELASRRESRR